MQSNSFNGSEKVLGRWLDKKRSKTQLEEANHYLLMLKGANDGVVTLVATSVMFWAEKLRHGGTDLYEIANWIHEEPMMPLALSKTIKKVQKVSPEDANGIVVWLHTARAALYPELKLTARLIWRELQRAAQTAEKEANNLALLEGISNPQCKLGPPVDFE